MNGKEAKAHDSVLACITDITECLKANSAAKKTLILQYQKQKWINPNTTPSETELVTIVLNRIATDAGQYDIFMDMLKKIEGMNLIVNKLKESESNATTEHETSQSTATDHQSTATDHETSRREIEDLKEKLKSSEAKVADLEKIVQQRDLDLEKMSTKSDELEQSSRKKIEDLKKKLQSSEDKVTDLENIVQERDSNLKILREKEEKLRRSSLTILTGVTELKNTLMEPETHMSKVSGPGLKSATANHPTHVIVELTDSSNRPCSVPQKVTAELQFISKAMPTSPSGESSVVNATVTATSPFQYEVSYTAVSRGQYQLHIQVNDREIDESPTITVYPDPNQLANPVIFLDGLTTPYSIGFTSNGEMIISEKVKNQISIFNTEGKWIGKFEQHEDRPIKPRGIAIDDDDNVYVSSEFKLQKFTSRGIFIKCVGQQGSKEGDFNGPYGITLHDNQLYVCDCNNHRIQVFDLDLNFNRSIGSQGKGEGEFERPYDVKFDSDHNMYVAEWGGGRVQVLDKNGTFIRMFEKNLILKQASALHIIDKYVYVSDWSGGHILVYETSGQFVTSFGGGGHTEGKFERPYCINSYEDQVYICDRDNGRIQTF